MSTVCLSFVKIRDEADDLAIREAALKAKETQKIQKEVITAKSQLEAIVAEFEAKIATASMDQLNALLKESESAIASIVEAHSYTEESSVTEADRSSLRVKPGDQVLVSGLGNKLATIVEVPITDGMALVQYGKVPSNSQPQIKKQVCNRDIPQIVIKNCRVVIRTLDLCVVLRILIYNMNCS